MLEKYESVKNEYDKISEKLSHPEVMSNMAEFQSLSKRQAFLLPLLEKLELLKKIQSQVEEAEKIIKIEVNTEMIAMAEDEVAKLQKEKGKLIHEIEFLMIPKDENDTRNVIMEIRAGTGGEESALFAAELFKAYSKFAENHHWQISIMNSNTTSIGGFKEVIFEVKGKEVYKFFKYESGTHRVQRIPETESAGRVHTSAITVAVLPEAGEVEVDINPQDLKIDVFRSQGAGGQSVNTTDSAVRITHIPSGMVVTCQDERSQIKNRAKAMTILQSRLLIIKEEEERKKRGEERKMQVGTGDRSEKIRTYNFPQNRITDHRINFSIYDIEGFMAGNIDSLVDQLAKVDKEKIIAKLKS